MGVIDVNVLSCNECGHAVGLHTESCLTCGCTELNYSLPGQYPRKAPVPSLEQVREVLEMYPAFPTPENVRKFFFERSLSQIRITERGVLAILRHHCTNYDTLQRLYPHWNHTVLRMHVNTLIKGVIGHYWSVKPGRTRK